MFDLHCHILPGLDDGSSGLDESLKMSRIAYNDGIRTILATPHTMNGTFINDRALILSETKKFQEILVQEDIELRILPGAEVHVNHNILELVRDGRALTVNDTGRYILLEFPHQLVPPNVPEFVFELKIKGITPIFAHPERNSAIQDDLGIISRLVEQGALTQIISMSITGEFGSRPYRCAIQMLKHNLAHMIASDAHSAGMRSPRLSLAVKKASEIVGQDLAYSMVTSIPEAIIKGEALPDLPEPKEPKKCFFRRIFG